MNAANHGIEQESASARPHIQVTVLVAVTEIFAVTDLLAVTNIMDITDISAEINFIAVIDISAVTARRQLP